MYQAYLLRSRKNKAKSYIGLTIKGISNRLAEHNAGKSRSTKPFLPWELVYYENFYCKTCAEQREKFLKSGFGYRLRKILLENIKHAEWKRSALQTGE